MAFETLDSRRVYEGRVFDVHREKARFPDGREADFDVVRHGGAVTIVPLDADGKVWFVRQYRQPVGDLLLELPAGTLEGGEPPEDCARREVREEIGMAAEKLERIGEFYLAPGYSSEYMHLFLATDLRPSPLEADPDEYLSVERYPLTEALAMIRLGRIQDAKTVAGLYLAQAYLSAPPAGQP